MTEVLVGIAALVIGIGIGFLVRKAIATSQVHSAEARAQKVVLDAQVEAKTVMKQSLVDGNEQIAALRREAEEDIRARREEIQRQERRVGDTEEWIPSVPLHLQLFAALVVTVQVVATALRWSLTSRRAWTASSPTSSGARRKWTIVTGRCSTSGRSSNGRRRDTGSGSRPWPG